MGEKKWFFLGTSLFLFTFGFLIGASNSPVVGAVITSIVGIAIAIVSLFEQDENKKPIIRTQSINKELVGKMLTFFSVSFLVGLFIGESYRTGNVLFFEKSKEFVWTSETSPEKAKAALDWIMVNEKLRALGYTKSQVEKIYELWNDEIQYLPDSTYDEYIEKWVQTEKYDSSEPFHTIIQIELLNQIRSIDSKRRGPAGEIEN